MTIRIMGFFVTAVTFAQQSTLHPAGRGSAEILSLGIFFTALLTVIFAIVLTVLLIALLRRHRGIQQEAVEETHRPPVATERRSTVIVLTAGVVTMGILVGLIGVSAITGKEIAQLLPHDRALVIDVTGNQWWWSIQYTDPDPHRILITANEMHIPVGRPVLIRGRSQDVIHSFWIPNLQGKRDLLPGHVTTQWIRADRPGRFRGQCAEFCGLQHAHMAISVIAEPEEQFQRWLDAQREPAAEPAGVIARNGKQVFLDHGCVLCHTIRGTPASGTAGPDLTHFSSRSTIAAGTLPNHRGNLAGWILDPQGVKPGNHMATIPLNSDETQALISYLEILK